MITPIVVTPYRGTPMPRSTDVGPRTDELPPVPRTAPLPRTLRGGLDWLLRGNRAALVVGLMLLVADAALIAVHLDAVSRQSANPMLYVDIDRSYAELLQYLKFLWLLALLVWYSVEQRSWQMATWLPVFAYFLADDALSWHESMGARVAGQLATGPVFFLSAQDVGEILVTAGAGLVLLLPLVVGYVRANRPTRWVFHVLAALLVVLAGFGVVVDALHMVVVENPRTGDWMGTLEDGGEMVVVTVVVAFVVRLVARGGEPGLALRAPRV